MSKHIVFLHGWGQSTKTWRENTSYFKSRGYRTHTIELPGFDLPDPPSYWGIPEYAKFVHDKLAHIRGSSRAQIIVVGHSFGGRIAVYLAANYPDDVSVLVLSGAAGVGSSPGIVKFLARAASRVFDFCETIVPAINRLRRAVIDLIGSTDYKNASGTLRSVFKNVVNQDLKHYLSDIQCPTLIIWGSRDRVTPMSMARVFNRRIGNSKLVTIKGAEHFGHVTHSAKWNECVYNYVEGLV